MNRWIGIILMVVGTIWLCVDCIWNLSKYNINALLVVPFVLLLSGVVIYVFALKKESRY